MCIALLSTAHPQYPFILLSNRDEFLSRPTARVEWWEGPNPQVLGGRDLQRSEKGTWLGITKQGRFAVLTNFRDEGVEVRLNKSRGRITNAFLTTPLDQAANENDEQFARRLMTDMGIDDVGGFSLVYGKLKPSALKEKTSSLGELSLLSNRTTDPSHLIKLLGKAGETRGLSNSFFGDETWPKVIQGEAMLKQAIDSHASSGKIDEKDFVESLFQIISSNTLPEKGTDLPWHEFTRELRNTILVPPIGGNEPAQDAAANVNGTTKTLQPGNEGIYGTQKQTVILVDRQGKVAFIERTLYDQQCHPIERNEQERRIEFSIES